MDQAYAELSLRAGWLAAVGDQHFGGAEYLQRLRERVWSLTPEFLAALKVELIQKGVPASEVEDPPTFHHHLAVAMRLQELGDAGHVVVLTGLRRQSGTAPEPGSHRPGDKDQATES